jgi:hypothetical protein
MDWPPSELFFGSRGRYGDESGPFSAQVFLLALVELTLPVVGDCYLARRWSVTSFYRTVIAGLAAFDWVV